VKTNQFIISLRPDRREQSWRFRKANRGEQLAQLRCIRLFFLVFSVPVVQRTEQGFPKGKTPLLHCSADVISCAQIAAIEPVELLLGSSRVITNLHIFTHPGDTKGDTKLSPVFVSTQRMTALASSRGKQFAA
jgi:hypothetical protein